MSHTGITNHSPGRSLREYPYRGREVPPDGDAGFGSDDLCTVPGLADIRRRFRRLLAPPGQPAEALGVPSAGEDIEAELGALLTELDAVAAEAQRIDREAEAEAERRRLAGIREAAVILEEARDRADAERARAASARTEAARAAVQAAQDAAQQRAAELRTQTEERIAGPLEEVLTCVRHFGR
jgi:hypothetical protein